MTGAAKHMPEFIDRLTAIVEANLQNEQFGVEELAREMNMSRSNLHRKITEAAKISASQFICQVRLKRALKLLEDTSATVSEAAYECGFHSATYFSKCFHDYYGYSPGKVSHHVEPEPPAKDPTVHQQKMVWKKWLLPAATLTVLGLLVFIISESAFFYSLNSGREETPNTIAILPLKFQGSDTMKIMAGGLTEAVLNRLMEVENLVIRSKTSVEQYRETTKTLKEIAKEMKVDYLIEMVGYQNGNTLQFQVNMTDAVSDAYLWRASYPAQVNDESTLDLQNRIAGDIALKTKTQLSSTEREILKERLTNNPAAMNAYLQGLNYLDLSNRKGTVSHFQEAAEEAMHAKKNFQKAIQLDSGFIAAYIMLGHIYINRINLFNILQRNEFLDSGLVLVEKAISLHSNRTKGGDFRYALTLKSSYMRHIGQLEESRRLFEEAIKYPPYHTPGNYVGSFARYCDFEDYYEAVATFFKYIELKPEEEIIAPWIYKNLGLILFHTGFPKVAENYLLECLNTTLDSLDFYQSMSYGQICTGDFESSIGFVNKALKINPNPYQANLIYNKTLSYIFLREFANAFETVKEVNHKNLQFVPKNYAKSLTAYVFFMNGQPVLADQYFREVITTRTIEISSGHPDASLFYAQFELATIYAALDEKENALNYLREVKNKHNIPRWMIIIQQYHPCLDNIRQEPEFTKLQEEFEKKYQEEHKRIELLLKDKGVI